MSHQLWFRTRTHTYNNAHQTEKQSNNRKDQEETNIEVTIDSPVRLNGLNTTQTTVILTSIEIQTQQSHAIYHQPVCEDTAVCFPYLPASTTQIQQNFHPAGNM